MRVRLAPGASTVLLAVRGPFDVYSPSDEMILHANGLAATNLAINNGTLRIADRHLPIERYLDVVPAENGSLTINHRRYRGSVRLHRLDDDLLAAVNHVRIDDYLRGVLSAELPSRFLPETYKAQAIAARTFALYEKFSRPAGAKYYDVTAGEASQVYIGIAAETSRSIAAVDKTRGMVLTGRTDRGWRIFPAFFSSTCGGRTQGGRYLATVDPDLLPLAGNVTCDTCRISPYYRWPDKPVPAVDICKRLNKRMGLTFRQIDRIDVIERNRCGRIATVGIFDTDGRTVTVVGERFRLIVGSRKMPSTWCQIRRQGGDFVFYDGKGLGHGVGMCQYGAEGMARNGHTAMDILTHYYPQSRIVRAY